MKMGIITVSDKGSKGEREDLSGPAIRRIVKAESYEYAVVPDEQKEISEKIKDFVDQKSCDLVLTTGGTGLSPRDVTPEATKAVIDREIPGIAEAIRFESYKIKDRAMLSRAIAGSRGKTLIINLPGSPRAVKECLNIVLPVIPHALEVLEKGSIECG
ncbi:molybdenum cofactor biosynthesis protein [candidate division WOR-1 bacterium RIFOXYA12_FULL_43_27]|uniref:Molybdenum cofactor biosynthesis protein B n=1 Tax=candidate division WOR-1 bacterium RIFOXYC2_FULL_46_14 TaxID=1802587 RepID=A0A1F4U5I5_UNCSA|nr:MAG: molybdenum cofactor biosynthesis protein [candidate division WOR-1 bacterium RIFOXYA12_FULL_43_27]OGC20346.1 MAG: molybdenum cofactor biosynthesis protein [candidate division WOR-1 bacterium RIFOXYB2_FULL_46_45]OGC31917.1 MAG: molybdenum cofactor biosynthesis protein [candidate division WOR-1 bacterium RIFOXYA2_FULL_46_56]OGC40192.1 MAG: molybdenum cofactor biosynthesis protein [candidate division WOR-1 bacterium RIFOXYC2_FULL_46_14]